MNHIHSKLLMVDGILSTIGTANMDFRSFEQNMEVNAIIYDRGLNSQLMEQFSADIERSKIISLDDWRKRSKIRKTAESFSRLFAPLM